MFDFLTGFVSIINIFDIIDILIITYVVYKAIMLIKETRAAQLVKGILVLLVVMGVSDVFNLTTVNFLLRNTMQLGVTALIVVFQPELRKMLEHVGRGSRLSRFNFFDNSARSQKTIKVIEDVCDACQAMSKDKIGALILFEHNTKLGDISNTGTIINADSSPQMICNVFFPNSPLHDGAMVVRDGKIYAAACFLPLSQNQEISRELGTRHRAAIGATEVSDAIAVIVSEETGKISFAKDGALRRNLTSETLKIALIGELLPNSTGRNNKKPFKNRKEMS